MKKIAKTAPYILLGGAFLLLVVLNVCWHDHWIDSDMAAEMMFSKLLTEGGHIFATPDWYYSTEFRFLYTHLIMAPLFYITNNWHVIRAITNIVFYVVMIWSYFYCVKPLKLPKWAVVCTSVILLLPFSETVMTHMQMGNTYLSHVIIVLVFFGMFLRLVDRQDLKKYQLWILTVLYVLLAIICGVSGVRYLLALQCPLVVAALIFLLQSAKFQQFRHAMNKENLQIMLQSKSILYLWYSLLGMVGSVVGYAINVAWVSRQYVFQTYDSTNFIAVYQGIFLERVQNTLGSLLMLFGYIPDKGVISLRGIVTIIAFVMIGIVGYCTVKTFKHCTGKKYFTVLFFVVAFAVNTFVFVFTNSTIVPRYYITVWVFVLPVLAIYFAKEEIAFDRMALGLLLAACLFLSTAKTVVSFIGADKNEDKRPVAEFLVENGYEFGYATYWNANIITELTDGQVEIANVLEQEELQYFTWSTPMKYYEEGYHEGKTFLLLTQEQVAEGVGAAREKTGEVVYEDANYVVYGFENVDALMQGVESAR